MYISTKDWKAYIDKLSMLNNEASRLMIEYVQKNGFGDRNSLIDYAYALVNKYGRGSAALSAAMYDAVAEVSGKFYAPAEIVDDVSVEDVAKTVNGTLKRSKNIDELGGAVSRLVKRQGADTTLYNARRDGAEFAWIPFGDTCSFCLMLASNGWQHVSKKTLKNGHAEHIHSNCDCNYAVRFSDNDGVDGYDPDVYKEIYDNAEGDTWQEKLNSMRREKYAKNKDEINAKKRENYAERQQSIKVAQSDEDTKQPLSVKGDFSEYSPLELEQSEIELLKQLHNFAVDTNNEYGMAIYDGGQTDYITDNKHNDVTIVFPKDAKNVRLLHSHTDDSPLSHIDLSALVKDNISGTTNISINNDVWSVRIGNGIKPTKEEFAEISNICYDEAIRTISEHPDFYNWTVQERYYMLIRERMYRICNSFEWELSAGNIDE